jgi:hypothetical protein
LDNTSNLEKVYLETKRLRRTIETIPEETSMMAEDD